mgnify:FL=1
MVGERSVKGSYDLHIHSVFSDGSQTVGELIAEAREQGLAGIAVVDHDSLRQLSSVRAEARAAGFPVLAGVEASCIDAASGRKVHILVYGLEATPDGSGPLERIVDETLALRCANTLWQAWTLERAGVAPCGHPATVASVLEVSRASTGVYKQHVMQALTGLCYRDAEYQRIYRQLFKDGGIVERDIPQYPEVLEVVRAAREQGGVPVLAHPRQMNSWDAVPALVTAGLMGIEAFHPDNDDAASARCFELAYRFGLMCTGGSDYHGRYGSPTCVGERFITPDEGGDAVARLFERERLLA